MLRKEIVSCSEWETQEEAFADLDKINKNFPPEDGWKKEKTWIERMPNGNWRAYGCYFRVPP